jgi:hypothetical protein
MDIKLVLRQAVETKAVFYKRTEEVASLCQLALAEIELQEEVIRGLQIEVDAARGSEQLLTIATHLMAAQLGSEWHSGRVYNMKAMASDAANAAEALIKELRTR